METRGEGDGPATNGVGKAVELDKGGNCAKIVRTQEAETAKEEQRNRGTEDTGGSARTRTTRNEDSEYKGFFE